MAMIDLTGILTAKDRDCVPELRELLAMQVNLSRQEPEPCMYGTIVQFLA